MHRLWLIAPGAALVLLGAHFYRAAAWPLVALSGVLLVALAWPRAWVARVVQLALVLGALEWLWTASGLVQARLALGQPWLRLALILGGVALATAASALVFERRALRAHFRRR